uniref:Gustatory receptor n=1 Tax=Tetranychus urticae TaxID=32264 RepID=T1KPD7_TETUR
MSICNQFCSIKTCLRCYFGIKDDSKLVGKVIDKFNSILLETCVLKKGYHQDRENSYSGLPNFGSSLFSLRLLSSIAILRFIIIISTNETSYIHVILGNEFYSASVSYIFHAILLAFYMLGLICREYCLIMEARGDLSFLSQILIIKDHGFDESMLNLSSYQAYIFKKRTQFCLLFWLYFIYPICHSFVPMLIAVHLFNPSFWSNPVYLVSSTIWCTIEVITFIHLNKSISAVVCTILIFIWLCVGRMKTIIERLILISTCDQVDQSGILVASTNRFFIQFLNDFRSLVFSVKYYCFYNFIIIAAASDFAIFFGYIIKIHSPLTSNLLGYSGFLAIAVGSLIIYACSAFWFQFNLFCGIYSALLARSKIKLDTIQRLKILHILEMCSYNGIKIGDFCIIKRTLLVYFLLENAAAIMLLVVNLRSLDA